MTAGFHSPMPPAPTGVADYSAALAGAMREFGRVELEPRRAGVRLYHLGNNPLHLEVYRRALAEPGIVVLHDAVLHHFLLGTLGERGYIEEFVFNYGEWYRTMAEDLWRNRKRSAADARYFRFAMIKRAAAAARAVVVHNEAAAEIVRRHAPRARVVEIPLLFSPPPAPPACEVERLRAELGVRPSMTWFAVFGYLRESKRLLSTLRAYAALRKRRQDVAMLIAGDWGSVDLQRAADPWMRSPGVIRVGHTPKALFWKLAHACDVCVNLRYPTAGESSAIGIHLMGIGKPVLVTRGGETAEFPDSACIRIDPDETEPEMLLECFEWLAAHPRERAAMGALAAGYIAEHHDLEAVARRYWELIRELS